jgi:hypothetical protein
MKRLQRKRPRRPSGAETLQDGESTKALRRKLSEAERSLKTFKKLTAARFLKELKKKEDFYYWNLGLFNSKTGHKFDQDVIHDPVFEAIRCLRERSWQTLVLETINARSEEDFTETGVNPYWAKAFKIFGEKPPADWIKPYDPEQEQLLASEFLSAVKQGDIARLKELVQLCEILETTKFNRPRERQADSRRWRYYVAYSARYFLEKGKLPDKKTVKQLAFITRLGDEFPYLRLPSDQWADEWKQRMETVSRPSEREWTRIFLELGLRNLPSAPTHPQS